MTTKKQRRARVAENRARFDMETKVMGLKAQQIDRERRERNAYDSAQSAKKRKAKAPIPENLLKSMEFIA